MRIQFKRSSCIEAALVALFVSLSAPLASAQNEGSSGSARPAATAAAAAPAGARVRATQRAVDASVPDDPAVLTAIAPYTARVRALETAIGSLTGELKKSGIGAGSLGNFVADAIRAQAAAKLGTPVLLAVTNSGGLRKNTIGEGALSTMDIYQLLPFENALVALDLTGEQLTRFLKVVLAKEDAQSGARLIYRLTADKKSELVGVKLGDARAADEREIDPATRYTIVTIDYLVKRGGDYAVLQEAQNVRPLGVTMRDAVIDYVKAETAAGRKIKSTLDGRFYQDNRAPAATKGDNPR